MPEGLKQGSINTSQESTNKRDKILQEFNFGEARNKSLEALKIRRRELINQTTIESKEERNSLREEIGNKLISSIFSGEGLIIKGDQLGYINALTAKGNRIDFNVEADKVYPGDVLKIEGEGDVVIIRGDKKVLVGKVKEGFVNPQVPTESVPAPSGNGELTPDTLANTSGTSATPPEGDSLQQPPEISAENTKEIEWFQKTFSKFNELLENGMDFEEVKKRAILYVGLENAKKSFKMNSHREHRDIEKLMDTLVTEPDNTKFQEKIRTKIEGFNNTNWTGSLTISKAELIARLTNETGLVVELFGGVKEEEKVELEGEDKVKAIRLNTFISSFEKHKEEPDYKAPIMEMYELLEKGELNEAIKKIEKLLKKDYKLNIKTIISDDNELFRGLRAIGDTMNAGKVGAEVLSLEPNLSEYITENAEKKESDLKSKAEEKYNQTLESLKGPPMHPTYYEFSINKAAQIEEFSKLMALIECIDEYIKTNGSENLSVLGDEYGNMKGLLSWSNLTDENAKMTQEMAIIVASFALTAGASSILSGAALVAKGAQAGMVAARTTQGTNLMARVSRGAGATVLRPVAAGTGAIARTAKIGATSINKLRSMQIVGDALIFTTAEGTLNFATNVPGDRRQSIQSFGEKLARNTIMFGLFAGFGEIAKGLISKFPKVLGKTKFHEFGTLSSGDVSAMYFLHVIETGEVTLSKEDFAILAAQVIGFRGGMKGFEKLYPKLNEKLATYRLKSEVSPKTQVEIDAIRNNIGKKPSIKNSDMQEGRILEMHRARQQSRAEGGKPKVETSQTELEVSPKTQAEIDAIRNNIGKKPSIVNGDMQEGYYLLQQQIKKDPWLRENYRAILKLAEGRGEYSVTNGNDVFTFRNNGNNSFGWTRNGDFGMPVSKGELGEMLVKIGQERAAIMKSVPKVNEVIPSRNTVLKVEKEIGEINKKIAQFEEQIIINEANILTPNLRSRTNEAIRKDIQSLKSQIEQIKVDNGIIEVQYDTNSLISKGRQSELKNDVRGRIGSEEAAGFKKHVKKEINLSKSREELKVKEQRLKKLQEELVKEGNGTGKGQSLREEISELEKEIKSEGVERSGHTKEVIYSDKNPALKHKVDVTSLKPGRTYISNQGIEYVVRDGELINFEKGIPAPWNLNPKNLWLKAIPADTLTLNNINTVGKSSVVLLGGRYFTVEI